MTNPNGDAHNTTQSSYQISSNQPHTQNERLAQATNPNDAKSSCAQASDQANIALDWAAAAAATTSAAWPHYLTRRRMRVVHAWNGDCTWNDLCARLRWRPQRVNPHRCESVCRFESKSERCSNVATRIIIGAWSLKLDRGIRIVYML